MGASLTSRTVCEGEVRSRRRDRFIQTLAILQLLALGAALVWTSM
jgi:hypothetical protein